MEPWLDSLSEDWKSEHNSSSLSLPQQTPESTRPGSAASGASQSRIPYLAHNRSKSSAKAKYLRSRSLRDNNSPSAPAVLAEQNASKLNVAAQQSPSATSGSQRQLLTTTLPRRASSVLSDSGRSVQHYTLPNRSTRAYGGEDIPEWKRRLAHGEDIAGDGCDLFAPIRLEGMFKAPSARQDENQPPISSSFDQPRPWSIPTTSSSLSTFDHFQSLKASRSRPQGLDKVEELNEEADTVNDSSRSDDAPVLSGSEHRFVRQLSRSSELASRSTSQTPSPRSDISSSLSITNLDHIRRDPRLRTRSEQEELRNEWISPVTLSKQNTIRDRALKDSMDRSAAVLQGKLEQLGFDDTQRPSSRSSDQDIGYGHRRFGGDESTRDDPGADLTSQSLPDDLSMGTQDFISQGGFVNKRRGGFSNEGSFRRRTLSPSCASSCQRTSVQPTGINRDSSPLLPAAIRHKPNARYLPGATSPRTPTTPEQVPHKQPLTSSPLKLFGNRDTFTNNKLLRVLNYFEDAGCLEDAEGTQPANNRVESELRMSQFGRGELDRYDFVKEVKLGAHNDGSHVSTGNGLFPGLMHSEPIPSAGQSFEHMSSNVATGQDDDQSVFAQDQGNRETGDAELDQAKRDPPSPLKDQTPKRRRTLLWQEIEVQPSRQQEGEIAVPRNSAAKLAGTKRKDARYDNEMPIMDPSTLASRQMLRPRTTHRRASHDAVDDSQNRRTIDTEVDALTNTGSETVSEAVLDRVIPAPNDARKTSVTTQDYMEEATRIMQMIRAKRKPKSSLDSVEEPNEGSELSHNAIAGADPDEVSSGDEFSRPPSRNGGIRVREQQRIQAHDPRVASHLRKYKESDDLELLIETSALEPMAVPDNARAEEAALVPIPDDEQQSSPPNIRIHDSVEMQSRRNDATSITEDPQRSQSSGIAFVHSSSANTTQRTIPTSSTGSSGCKGVINPGKVQIPDQIGAMTFDHATRTWIKEQIGADPATDRRARQATSEEDPFEHISDLSAEEPGDAKHCNGFEAGGVSRPSSGGSSSSNEDVSSAKIDSLPSGTKREPAGSGINSQKNPRSQLIEHEMEIHDGRVSQAPSLPQYVNKQPRVVTIAFSSPLVSAVAYQEGPSTSELELSVIAQSSQRTRQTGDACVGGSDVDRRTKQNSSVKHPAFSKTSRYESWPGQSLVVRPVSRIEEQDEVVGNEDMSLIPACPSQAMTPLPRRSEGTLAAPYTACKTSSIICLTPLSDFSLHQTDKPLHEEASYVAPRRHPGALRQAHGALALGLDDMMRAIRDAEPSEPYWDQIRRLDLAGSRLTTLHRLEEYCSTLEELIISTNELGQLSGVPPSVRMLDARKNRLSCMTSWGHLQNLQYLDISGNELETLEGLACLYHLRDLNANDNKIRDIDGILDLNGLQSLSLERNKLESLDFEGGELTRLTRLDASHNQLTHVQSLSWLPALEVLNLEHNDISEILPSTSTPSTSLRHLRLSTNQLRSVDLSACPNVESLYLDRNSITRLSSLDCARHLQTLSLREQTDSPDIIGHVLSTPNDCRKIFLSSNALPDGKLKLPSQPLYSVRFLELASCGLSSIPVGFGSSFPNCRVLNMNFNALGCIVRLQGLVHLNKLLLAGNRLDRLRRTCLALSRHPTLTKLDIRNNPLTVGFYSPAVVDDRLVLRNSSQPGLPTLQDPYALPQQVKTADCKWLRLLDQGTRLRRRTTELLLAQKCVELIEVNGLAFDRDDTLQPDEEWDVLTELGVLKRPMLLPQRPSSAQREDSPLWNHARFGVADAERSLMIE